MFFLRSILLGLVAGLLTAGGSSASTQGRDVSTSPLHAGDRIRLVVPSLARERFEALVGDVREGAVVLHSPRLGPLGVTVDTSAMTQVERSLGRTTQASSYAGRGFLIGAGLGMAIGLASGDDPPGFVSFTAGQKALLLGIGFGLWGTLTGAAIGAYVEVEKWQTVHLESATVGLLPNRSPGVVLAFGF